MRRARAAARAAPGSADAGTEEPPERPGAGGAAPESGPPEDGNAEGGDPDER